MPTITLSSDAQRIIQEAQTIAENRKHNQLDSAHLFWVLGSSTDTGRNWLQDAGCKNIDLLLKNLESAFQEWFFETRESPEPSQTYILVMRQAQEFALLQYAQNIESEHIFRAIVDLDTRLLDWLQDHGLHPSAISTAFATPTLDRLGRNLTQLAKEGTLNPVFGRDKEVSQLIEVLMRQGKNSALLLGLSGVGKTAVVERLAHEIADGHVPAKLSKMRLIELNMADLVAGTSFRGELEERLQELLREIQQADDVVLVIDEFHTVVGAGATRDSSLNTANMLKPALARGELTCIGITTQEEFTQYVEKDQALVRRFHPIHVAEPSIDETRLIIQALIPRYESHHNITVGQQAIEAILKLCTQYLSTRQFPDKAIDVLGKVCSRAEIQQISTVDATLITQIVSEMAGIPIGLLQSDLQQVLVALEENLSKSVIGQDAAVSTLAKSVRLAYTGLRDPNRPKGIFMFVGASGVGKTQLARSLAELLFGSDKKLLRLDMSEYSDKYTISRLIGAAPGYIGHDEPGQLTQPLRNQPHSVVLLDEIEKAHPEVFDIFLQLFGEGRLTDSHGRPVDGRHAIFIMTTNLGAAQVDKRGLGFKPAQISSEIQSELKSFFRPEFLNRVDHIIQFRSLDFDDLIAIARLEMQVLKARLAEQSIRLTYTVDVLEFVVTQANVRGSAARGLKAVVESLVAIPISEKLVSRAAKRGNWVHLDVEMHGIKVDWL